MEIKRNQSIEEWATLEVCNNWGSTQEKDIENLSEL